MAGIRILQTSEDFSRYDAWVKGHPHGSLWQSLEWKRYQETMGREVRIYVMEQTDERAVGSGQWAASLLSASRFPLAASALVVIDRTRGGWSTWDVPRGPLWQLSGVRCQVSDVDAATKLLDTIAHDAKRDRCLTLFLSPPVHLKAESYNLKASPRHEQPSATRVIDLTKSDDEILAQMHPKGRYNIRIAQKHGVQIEQSDDVGAFYNLLRETAERDGFRILPLKAYKTFLECLPGSFLLMVYEAGTCRLIAGLLGVIWGKNGIYYYGASSYAHRALMAPYALQWEAMRLCRERGCTQYDLLGVAPAGERETRHPWAGVSAFKEKFGGTVVTFPPEQQIVLRPVMWMVLQWKRWMVG